MEYPYSYISSLDSLVYDSEVDANPLDHEAAEADLALWSNAQFTFDVQPGSGILDNDKSAPNASYLGTDNQLNTIDPAMYEKLVNYLDYELPAQQRQQQQPQTLAANPSTAAAPPQKLLLPKITRSMPTFETPAIASRKKAIKRATPESEIENENSLTAEDDKRRRNTAASARFRVKKKQREQAMEKTVREMTDQTEKLQDRVKELEVEVKWLRGLLVEKEAKRSEDSVKVEA